MKKSIYKQTKKSVAILLALAFLFALLPVSALAKSQKSQRSLGDYNAGDVAVINSIIKNNGLKWNQNDPDAWTASGRVAWSQTPTNKRITRLNVFRASLTGTLDVSALSDLQYLVCQDNSLTGLNVNGLANLIGLQCANNKLTHLDTDSLTGLLGLDCSSNKLTQLSTKSLGGLTMLLCRSNQLASLETKTLVNMVQFDCSANKLTSLDVSKMTHLYHLYCAQNSLTALNVSGLTDLRILYCDRNKIATLDVSRLTALEDLSCSVNPLKTLDVRNLSELKSLNCGAADLTSLNLVNQTKLIQLNCALNRFTSLDISRLTKLQQLRCDGNLLTSLNADGLSELTVLTCGGNKLTSISLNGTPSLSQLSCGNNKLTSIDISGSVNLAELRCELNQISSLDVSVTPGLYVLDCHGNRLTSLNLSTVYFLIQLDCSYNKLTALDVTSIQNLGYLDCSGNELTALNVAGQSALESLDASSNRIASLDVSALENLKYLSCDDNLLTGMALNPKAKYVAINLSYNRIPDKNAVTGQTIAWDTGKEPKFRFSPQGQNKPNPEPTPNAHIDFENEAFAGLVIGGIYKVDGSIRTADTRGMIAIDDTMMDGKSHSIIKNGNGSPTVNSTAQEIVIPKRPGIATGLQGVNESNVGVSDGKITGVTPAMEYRRGTSGAWTVCSAAEVTGLPAGTYYVRNRATASVSFAGLQSEVPIGSGNAQTCALAVQPPEFDDEQEGYAQPDAKPIIIWNTGNSPAAIKDVTVTGDAFTVAGSGKEAEAGKFCDTWTICPKSGLSAGVHEGIVTVTYNDGKTTKAEVSFSVETASLTEGKISIKGIKSVRGKDASQQIFSFSLTQVSDANGVPAGVQSKPISKTTSVTANGEGDFAFEFPTFRMKPGTYWFEVRETIGGKGDGWTNDTAPKTVKVQVSNIDKDADGLPKVSVEYPGAPTDGKNKSANIAKHMPPKASDIAVPPYVSPSGKLRFAKQVIENDNSLWLIKDASGREFCVACGEKESGSPDRGNFVPVASRNDSPQSLILAMAYKRASGLDAPVSAKALGSALSSIDAEIMQDLVWFYEQGEPLKQSDELLGLKAGIDAMMAQYKNAKTTSLTKLTYTPVSEHTGTLTFGHDGYVPKDSKGNEVYDTCLSWEDTQGLSVTITPQGGKAKEYTDCPQGGVSVKKSDRIEVSYTGKSSTKFVLTDKQCYLKAGSIKGDYMSTGAMCVDALGVRKVQNIITGHAEFVNLEAGLTLNGSVPQHADKVTVLNTYEKPTTPPEKKDPDKKDPDKKDPDKKDPDNKKTGKSEGPGKLKRPDLRIPSSSPKTGDESSPLWYASVLISALLAIAALVSALLLLKLRARTENKEV